MLIRMKPPDIFFYEAFEEEAAAIAAALPDTIRAGFTDRTIQEKREKREGHVSIFNIRSTFVTYGSSCLSVDNRFSNRFSIALTAA